MVTYDEERARSGVISFMMSLKASRHVWRVSWILVATIVGGGVYWFVASATAGWELPRLTYLEIGAALLGVYLVTIAFYAILKFVFERKLEDPILAANQNWTHDQRLRELELLLTTLREDTVLGERLKRRAAKPLEEREPVYWTFLVKRIWNDIGRFDDALNAAVVEFRGAVRAAEEHERRTGQPAPIGNDRLAMIAELKQLDAAQNLGDRLLHTTHVDLEIVANVSQVLTVFYFPWAIISFVIG